MRLLGTTVPGLEAFAAEDVEALLGVEATVDHPGAVSFDAHPAAVPVLNNWSRSLHRVLLVLADGVAPDLQTVYDIARSTPIERYVAAGQSFGVRATRHGDHPFGSPDVADRVGQAIVDRSRAHFGERLPVDLDNPTVTVRAHLREDRLLLSIDTTGAQSLHRRSWRVCEHDAPLRPTLAHAMLRFVGYRPGDSLLDPMCGGGTIPIEAARWAGSYPPNGHRTAFAYDRLAFPFPKAPHRALTARSAQTRIRGFDHQARWIDCATENATAADVEGSVTLAQRDATTAALDADVIAVDLPFGIRTDDNVPALYRDFSNALAAGDWDRFVALTTRPELLEVAVDRQIELRVGRLEATLLRADR